MASLIEPILITCPTFISGAKGISITLPGGAAMSYQSPTLWADSNDVCRGLLGQLQGALVPMKPLFDVIAAVLCLKDIVTAIPDAIEELNPGKVSDTIRECLPRIENLLQLVPQLSVPIMVCQVLSVLTCVIEGATTELQIYILKQTAILEASQLIRGSSDPLFNIVECANRLNANRLCAVNESMSPINSIIELINVFLTLIGLDPLPTFGEMAAEATVAIDQLRDLVSLLRTLQLALGCGPVLNTPRC